MVSDLRGKGLWHVIAVVVSVLWGATFVSSKVLLTEGMSPAEIMVIRFALSYVCILPFSVRRRPRVGGPSSASVASGCGVWRQGCLPALRGLFADNVRDEQLFVVAGLSGGSLYFLCENTALIYSQASNVSILIATTPLLTALLSAALFRDGQVTPRSVAYSVVALVGVVIVVLNGEFVLDLHPLGDVLTLAAVLLWVLYSIVIKLLDERYPASMLTRKVFFYGAVTMLPCFLWQPWGTSLAVLCKPTVLLNLFFLGFIASFLCYYAWNRVLAEIGPVATNNYLYLNPLATAILAVPVLGERFTWISVTGSVLIIAGMYLASRRE